MNTKSLFSGIGVVIDDMLDDVVIQDRILDIISSLEDAKMPLVKYKSLPDEVTIKDLCYASFILLDWQLYRTLSSFDGQVESIKVADSVINANNRNNTIFVNKLITETTVPLFIFSNKDDVKDDLIANGIPEDTLNLSPVFFKRKDELFNEAGEFILFEALEEWVKSKPAVYVLKEWSHAFNKAKEDLLNEFSRGSHQWPRIIWESAAEDRVDESNEVSSLLIQNIASRMTPVEFDSTVITNGKVDLCKDELLSVLQAQRYMKVANDAMAVVGDVYVFEPDRVNAQGVHTNPENREIAINIRPTCDCVFRDDPIKNIYLLFGRKLSEGAQKERYDVTYHKFDEHDTEAIVGPIVDNSYYSIKFKDIKVVPFETIRNLRKGRILEPFISHVTERYSLYIQRHAMPSLPPDAVCVRESGEKSKNLQIRTLQEENKRLETMICNLKENILIIERRKRCIMTRFKCNGRKKRK